MSLFSSTRKKEVRRVTGVPNEMSARAKYTLIVVASLVALLTVTGVCYLMFKLYFRSQELFTIRDMKEDVTITTGKSVTADLISDIFNLHNGMNLFDIMDEKGATNKFAVLKEPIIKDYKITRILPNKVEITVTEREAVAKVSPEERGFVTDEEGVIFNSSRDTGLLPLIVISDEFEGIKTGQRLSGLEKEAVKLIMAAQRPDFRLRIEQVNCRKKDHLVIRFTDYRDAKFAWKGMLDKKVSQDDSMFYLRKQLAQLADCMESEIGRPRQHWDARLENRIHAMPFVSQ
ncbi:MAG: FtsQ-type POTRA domain-containing protein [Kiritimatiellae bacterium]|nr:FtsQ-type POTRA domain-containing protein [Kiritimatiellia bacterium]